MVVLEIIFVIFLGLLPLGEIVRFDLGDNFFIKPVDIAAVILFTAWIPQAFKKWGIESNKLFIPILSVAAIMCISLVINVKNFSGSEIFVGLSYTLRWILYASLFFIVKDFSKKFKEKIIYLLLVVGALFTILGFIQYFFYSSLRNLYYLGWDEHMYRMFSTFLDPNFAGAFFVLFFFFSLSILLYFFKNNRIKRIWLMSLVVFFSLISIFLTFSRSALIMLFSSIIIFSILTKKIYWTFGFVLISLVFILISSKNFNVENINLFRIASAEARIDSAKIAIQIIKDNPFLGIGFNTYRYVQIEYGFRNPVNTRVSHADAGTDNSFLFVFATTGIIGLIIYLNLLLQILKRSYLTYKQYKDQDVQRYIGLIIVVSIGGIMVDSFFINSLFYSSVMIWMWVLLGLIESN